jgi:RNA polymerase sigma factor (sigma-70 family)
VSGTECWQDDEGLLVLARQGDQGAVAELYRRHHAVALRAASCYAHPDYPAEDLAADAFTALLRALADGGGPQSSVGGYLMASMRNAAASRARRRAHRHAPSLAQDEQLHAVVDDGPGPDHHLLREDSRRHLRAALGQLPSAWRQVLVLTLVEGRGVGEVGEQLGLQPTAARALAYRARRGLREAYAGIDADGAFALSP